MNSMLLTLSRHKENQVNQQTMHKLLRTLSLCQVIYKSNLETAGAGSGTAGITNVINQIYSKSEGGSFDLGNVLNALNPYSSKY